MKIYNSLTRKTEVFEPLKANEVGIYSCGPTVYDHIHIGNLSAFVTADILRRALRLNEFKIRHVMNYTDVDDKTIRRSSERYPEESPEEALSKLTEEYIEVFQSDMQAIGNDIENIIFVKATSSIDSMQKLISNLYNNDFAYIADDGVYFSIEKYKSSGKVYGQLLELDASNTSNSRIDNDEYDKESIHDFALWKTRKGGEPAWDFELDGHNLLGRPGWHIECSAMSVENLGQPFDIHTGGVDLIFPHHENEIAQSTALGTNSIYAKYFVHNEHLLVDDKKMSKSLSNFYTLRDIQERDYNPMSFRLMLLQSHYRSKANFTWELLEAAQNRLKKLQSIADLKWQMMDIPSNKTIYDESKSRMHMHLNNDLNTPMVLAELSELETIVSRELVSMHDAKQFDDLLEFIDKALGIDLVSNDISDSEKGLIKQRQTARDEKDWKGSDDIRHQLEVLGLGIRDTELGQIWFRL